MAAVAVPVARNVGPSGFRLLRPFSSEPNSVKLPDFADTVKAYQYKSTWELRRAYWVYWLFKYDALVDKSLQVYRIPVASHDVSAYVHVRSIK